MKEEYRVVLNGRYQVSNLGNVRKKYRDGKWKQFVSKTNSSYITLSWREDNKTKKVSLHRIIAITFIPNEYPTIRCEVNHIDGNKKNNAVSNLQWVSRSENVQHAYDLGLCKGKKSKRDSMEYRVSRLEREVNNLKKLLSEPKHG